MLCAPGRAGGSMTAAKRIRRRHIVAVVVAITLAAGCGDDSSETSGDPIDPTAWSEAVCGQLAAVGEERAADLAAAYASVPTEFSSDAELATAVPALAEAYRQTALLIGDYLTAIAEAGEPDVDDGRAFVTGVLDQLETAEDAMLDAVDRLEGLGAEPTVEEYQVVATRLSDLAEAQRVLSFDIGTEGPAELAAAYDAEPSCERAAEIFAALG